MEIWVKARVSTIPVSCHNLSFRWACANSVADNVEKIIWENVPGDTFKIVVSIWNNLDIQAATSFAVAWDICPLARL